MDLYRPLSLDTEVDVCVIGGGITGLTTAFLLSRRGKKVVLLEADRIGAGTTGASSAHLDPLSDNYLQTLARKYGQVTAKRVVESGIDAIQFIENFTFECQVDCDFKRVPGWLFTERESDLELLQHEASVAQSIGLKAEMVDRPRQPFASLAGLKFDVQARFNPLKYIYGLADAARAYGCRIYENSRVTRVDHGSTTTIHTHDAKVRAKEVVMATHIPFGRILSVQTRVFPYRSYILTFKAKEDIGEDLYWDTMSPYHYIRQVTDSRGRWIILGGADHKVGQKEKPGLSYEHLLTYAKKHFTIKAPRWQWSAQYYPSSDDLPYIGRAPFNRHLFIATGYSGNGLTFGTIAGHLIADEIMGRRSPWRDLYTPMRLQAMASAKSFFKENLNVAEHFIMDRWGVKDSSVFSGVEKGEGKIVQVEGGKYAVYRDERNELYILSPVCTHAKCIVHWNSSEKSWDCPCHGGRYRGTGEVIMGPPTKDLQRILLTPASQMEKVQGRIRWSLFPPPDSDMNPSPSPNV